MAATKWSVEIEYSESDIDEAICLSWGIATPEERAELNTTYNFFASEKEAARRFLSEVRVYPSARALADDIELAKKALNL